MAVSANITRRGLLHLGALATVTATGAAATEADADPYEDVRRRAESLAAAMEALEGRGWTVHIDHDVGLVAVSRIFSKGAAS